MTNPILDLGQLEGMSTVPVVAALAAAAAELDRRLERETRLAAGLDPEVLHLGNRIPSRLGEPPAKLTGIPAARRPGPRGRTAPTRPSLIRQTRPTQPERDGEQA